MRPALAQTAAPSPAATAPAVAPMPSTPPSTVQTPAGTAPASSPPAAGRTTTVELSAPNDPPIPVAFAAKLEPIPVKFGRFTMRPPLGYVEMIVPIDGGQQAHAWTNVPVGNQDDTSVLVFDVPGTTNTVLPSVADQIIPSVVTGIERSDYKHGWYLSPVNEATINGRVFSHVTFRGAAKANGPTTYGVYYMAIANHNTLIVAAAHDNLVDHGAALGLLSASLKTLTVK